MDAVSLYFILFFSGVLTLLLPCILPLLPVVLGVSLTGKSRWQPVVVAAGMVVSFVAFTFLLQVVLSQFVTLADVIRISTYYILLLFGVCFLTSNKNLQILGAVLGGFFFWRWGWAGVTIAEVAGWLAIEIGGRVASWIQQLGTDVQGAARAEFGTGSLLTAFVIGLTLGLVWVPCAGPALGFALTLVRDQPGTKAFLALSSYGIGAALPLLLIGYGGQYAAGSVRALSQYSGRIKQIAGALLIISALSFQFGWFQDLQTWLVNNTTFGTLGTRIEENLFGDEMPSPLPNPLPRGEGTVSLPSLPTLARAPELTGLGPWHNSKPLTLKELRGKVVLVDFWTYSCINCIRTFPYMREYWKKYMDMPFVLIGIHTPEFVFEKDPQNVADAIERHGLTYPVAQDNDYATWDAFSNRYWPAKYLIDKDGYIRYTHFGEGNYDATDLAIQSLLAEIGMASPGKLVGEDEERMEYRERSPETYLGERSWESFRNAQGDPDEEVHSYMAPKSLPLHTYALVGDWQLIGGERQVLRSSTGEIRYRALASEVNLVLGLEKGAKPVQAEIFVDGVQTKTFTIDRHDLFNLFTGPYGEHEIILKIRGAGVAGYAYTFGS